MRSNEDQRGSLIIYDPEIKPSILANIPACLRNILQESLKKSNVGSFLVSSNSLANRFIIERWGILPSQRRRFKNLFASVRKECRHIFQHYLNMSKIAWSTHDENFILGVYKFDEIRSNLILGFRDLSHFPVWRPL